MVRAPPAEQLEAVKYLNTTRGWGFIDADFPSVPENVTLASTELLSLAIYLPKKGRMGGLQRTVKELWALAPSTIGDFAKWLGSELKTDSKHLRLARGSWRPGIRWVVIDLAAYAGKSPKNALETISVSDSYQPAGVELLALLLLQPDWALSWDGQKFFYPNLAGLQFYYNEAWSHVPCLRRWGRGRDRQFELDTLWAGRASALWSSPCFREC